MKIVKQNIKIFSLEQWLLAEGALASQGIQFFSASALSPHTQ